MNTKERFDGKRCVVIYHDDLDGRCSAFILKKFVCECRVVFVPYVYGDKLVLPEYKEDDLLYILDVSLKRDELINVIDIYDSNNICWIDHHKSGIDLWNEFPYIKGIRFDGMAACELTWHYFFRSLEVPHFVRVIANRDLWQFNFYGDETIWFFEYFDTIHNKPEAAIWNLLYDDEDKTSLNSFIEKGKVLRYAKLRNLNELMKRNAYEIEIDGYKCLMMNHSDYGSSSDLCHIMLSQGYEVVICYKIKQREGRLLVDYNIRSKNDVDCSVMATKRGGGGHKYASGWFDVLNENSFLMKTGVINV